MATYTLSRAAELAGVPQPTASRWVKAGIIRPEGYVGRRGVPVLFGEKELLELRTISALRGAGLSFQALRRAADQLRKWGRNPFSVGPSGFAVISGPRGRKELVEILDPDNVTQVTGEPGQLLLVPLWRTPNDDGNTEDLTDGEDGVDEP